MNSYWIPSHIFFRQDMSFPFNTYPRVPGSPVEVVSPSISGNESIMTDESNGSADSIHSGVYVDFYPVYPVINEDPFSIYSGDMPETPPREIIPDLVDADGNIALWEDSLEELADLRALFGCPFLYTENKVVVLLSRNLTTVFTLSSPVLQDRTWSHINTVSPVYGGFDHFRLRFDHQLLENVISDELTELDELRRLYGSPFVSAEDVQSLWVF